MSTPTPKRQTNRRSSMRRSGRRSIKLQCRRGALGLGPNIALAMTNISETGVQLLAAEALAPGDEVEVLLEGYGMRRPIKRAGRVRWAVAVEGGGCRIGVHFDKLLNFRDLQTLSAP